MGKSGGESGEKHWGGKKTCSKEKENLNSREKKNKENDDEKNKLAITLPESKSNTMLQTKPVSFPEDKFSTNIFDTIFVRSYRDNSKIKYDGQFYRSFQPSRIRIFELLATAFNDAWSGIILKTVYDSTKEMNKTVESQECLEK